MRKNLFLAAFLLLGPFALKAQQQYEAATLMVNTVPRLYPAVPPGESTFYLLDLSKLPSQTKKADDKGFKVNKISVEDFIGRKWTKDEKTQELFFSGSTNENMNLVILLPAELNALGLTRTIEYTERVPAIQSMLVPQFAPATPAIFCPARKQ